MPKTKQLAEAQLLVRLQAKPMLKPKLRLFTKKLIQNLKQAILMHL